MKSNRILVTFALAVAVMMFATVAFAQDPPRRDAGGPGGPGFHGRGPGMLPPDVMNSLSVDQKAQVESIRKAEHAKMQELDNQALTQAQYRAQSMEIRKGTQTQIESILTPDQKAKLAAAREKHGPGGPGGPGGHRPPPPQSNQ
jgi:Spy/CpxP family protein refolding chaperone